MPAVVSCRPWEEKNVKLNVFRGCWMTLETPRPAFGWNDGEGVGEEQ